MTDEKRPKLEKFSELPASLISRQQAIDLFTSLENRPASARAVVEFILQQTETNLSIVGCMIALAGDDPGERVKQLGATLDRIHTQAKNAASLLSELENSMRQLSPRDAVTEASII